MTKTYMEDLEIGIQFLTTHYVSYIGCGGEQTTVYKGVETFRGVLKPWGKAQKEKLKEDNIG